MSLDSAPVAACRLLLRGRAGRKLIREQFDGHICSKLSMTCVLSLKYTCP